MKKIISIYLFLSISFAAAAQTQTGKLFLGGNLGWDNYETDSNNSGNRMDEQNTLTIQSNFGTFIKDNLVLGLFVDYENIHSENINSVEGTLSGNKSKTVSIGPMMRKFFPLNDKFAFYGHGKVGYGRGSNRQTTVLNNQSVNFDSKYNSFVAGLRPGLVYFATKSLGLDLSVQGLQYTAGKEKDSEKSSSRFNAGFDLPNLTIGLNLYLGR